jgi:hypothetical protein
MKRMTAGAQAAGLAVIVAAGPVAECRADDPQSGDGRDPGSVVDFTKR